MRLVLARQASIRREMRPLKGHFEVVPFVGNKLFSSFGKKKKHWKHWKNWKKYYFWKKVSIFGLKTLYLEKIFTIFGKKKYFLNFNNLMTWQFSRHVNNLRGIGIFHWNEAPKFGSSKITRGPSLGSFFF